MFMIVILHILGAGGVISNTKTLSVNYEVGWFIETAAFCAVNCYALISGYVGVFAKHKYSNLVMLWLRVIFYTVGITIIFMIIQPGSVGKRSLVSALFPVFTNQYWYFTSYVILFLFIPLLNNALNTLSKKQIQVTLITILVIISVIFPFVNAAFGDDIFLLGYGYSAWWLIILYLVGGYVRKYGLFKRVKTGLLLLCYLIVISLVWVSKLVIHFVTQKVFGSPRYEDMWISYISVFVLLAAVFLLLFFERISIKETLAKFVGFISPLVFSVYLIHLHPLVFKNLIVNQFTWIGEKPVYVLVPVILGIAFAILIVSCLIDLIRHYLFKLLKLRERLNRVEHRIRAKISSK